MSASGLTIEERDAIARQYPSIRRRIRAGLRRRGIPATPDTIDDAAAHFCGLLCGRSLRRKIPLLTARIPAAVWYAVMRVADRRAIRADDASRLTADYVDAIAPQDLRARQSIVADTIGNVRAAQSWRVADLGRCA